MNISLGLPDGRPDPVMEFLDALNEGVNLLDYVRSPPCDKANGSLKADANSTPSTCNSDPTLPQNGHTSHTHDHQSPSITRSAGQGSTPQNSTPHIANLSANKLDDTIEIPNPNRDQTE